MLNFSNKEELKEYFRTKVKILHPDRGGDKEEYLKFIEWYKSLLKELREREQVSVVKKYVPQGKTFYCFYEFNIHQIALAETVEIELPLREKLCPECGGMGKNFYGKKEECSYCKGRGFLKLVKGKEEIEFLECFFCNGKGKLFTEACPRCLGKGRVREEGKIKIKLPSGLKEGDLLRIPGANYGAEWDFYVEISIKKHPFLRLEEDKVVYEKKIPFYEILLKETISIETLEGIEEIPTSLFYSGEPVVLKGRGPFIEEKGTLKRGDLVINLKITFPFKVSSKGKNYLEKLIKGNHFQF